MNVKKISQKLEKMAFYVVILIMFQFSVFWSILIKSAYILRYLDIKGITFHFNHSLELSQFLRKGRPLLQILIFFTFGLQFHEENGTKHTDPRLSGLEYLTFHRANSKDQGLNLTFLNFKGQNWSNQKIKAML